MSGDKKNIIIYNTVDGKASVSLYARDGMVWMNQKQIAELFDTTVPNISMHISNILKEGELEPNSVVKDYLTTAADGANNTTSLFTPWTWFWPSAFGCGASGAPSFGSGLTTTSRNTWSRALSWMMSV